MLAWLGGIAVLAGLAFLLTIAISRGWLGEGARTALAGVLSPACSAPASGCASARTAPRPRSPRPPSASPGCSARSSSPAPVYHLVPTPWRSPARSRRCRRDRLATRWHAQLMGWLGLLGALFAPAALGAIDGGASSSWRSRTRRRSPCSSGSAGRARRARVRRRRRCSCRVGGRRPDVAVLVVFGALTAALALGLEANRRGLHRSRSAPSRARVHPARRRAARVNAALLVPRLGRLDGEPGSSRSPPRTSRSASPPPASPRISRQLALITLGIGVVLADLALASLTTGLPLVLGWAVPALPFAALLGARRAGATTAAPPRRPDHRAPPTTRPRAAPTAPRPSAGLARPDRRSRAARRLLASTPRPVRRSPAALAADAPRARRRRRDRRRRLGLRRGSRPRAPRLLDALALTAVAHFTGLALEGCRSRSRSPPRRSGWPRSPAATAIGSPPWPPSRSPSPRCAHARVLAPPNALFDGLDAPARRRRRAGRGRRRRCAVSRVPLGAADARRSCEPAPRSRCSTWPASRSSRPAARARRPDAAQRAVGARRRRRAVFGLVDRRRDAAPRRLGLLARHGGEGVRLRPASRARCTRAGRAYRVRPAAAVRRVRLAACAPASPLP